MDSRTRDIQAKTLLATVKCPGCWFGIRYNMNIYRGCEHRCIYCDSRSECYQIENFDNELLVKSNALELLEKDLKTKRIKGIVGTGSMSDPYTLSESRLGLTGQALKIIARYGFGIHITTKSDLILKDLDTLVEINRFYASAAITITTTDDNLARVLEPYAPSPSSRLEAVEKLAEAGIHTGITMMPVLPFICDNAENIDAIVERAAECGASFILPGFGVTLRNRQRQFYYAKLDAFFPGLRGQYERAYRDSYSCESQKAGHLWKLFKDKCDRYGIKTDMAEIAPDLQESQLSLF